MDSVPKIRLSRSTNNLEKLITFYCRGLGFEILDRYEDLNGWDGVICGHKGWPYQLEFSQRREVEEVPRAPTQNHFVVFSIPDDKDWKDTLASLYESGFQQVTNPRLYRDPCTASFEDPDGYRLVLRKGTWKK